MVVLAIVVAAMLAGCDAQPTSDSSPRETDPVPPYNEIAVSYDGNEMYEQEAEICADLAIEAAAWVVADGISAEVTDDQNREGERFHGTVQSAAVGTRYEWTCEVRVAQDYTSLTAVLITFEPVE
jgi:hypothetical protein